MSYPSNTTSLTRARPPKQLFFGSRINPVFRSQRFQTQLGQQPPYGFLHLLLKFFLLPPTTARSPAKTRLSSSSNNSANSRCIFW